MRNFATAALIAAGVALLTLPVARAQDENDQQAAPPAHVQQHQQVTPQDSTDQHGQSAQAPGVITPPATDDPSVIKPPAAGAKMPIIPPPGTPGGGDDVQPK